jgi:Alg9-like mannosyltransferase family
MWPIYSRSAGEATGVISRAVRIACCHHAAMHRRAVLALAGLALLLVQAWRSDGYYHPDEYFQTVEFASFKLGLTRAGDLPWEFGERLRPFLQPAVYYAVAGALRGLGALDPGTALFAFRLLGALLGWTAVLLLWRALAPRLPDERSRDLLLASSLFTWYLPFLLVRTTGESISGSLLAIGLAAWLLLDGRPHLAAVAAGLAMGLSFDARYQVALSVAGFVAWLALVRRAGAGPIVAFAGAFLAMCAVGLVLDRWGYGAWTLTPWNYLRVNLLEGRAAAQFGRDPATYYLTSLALVHAPLSALLLVAVGAFWVKAPRDAITWLTLPFFVGHTLLARKSVRFMLPLGVLAASMGPLLLLDPRIPLGRMRTALAGPLGRKLLAVVVSLDLAFAAALVLVPVRHDLSVQHGLREILSRGDVPVLVLDTDPFVDGESPLAFLRPAKWRPERAGSWAEVEARLEAAGGRAFVVSWLHDLPPEPWRSARRLRLVASPLPEWLARILAVPLRRTALRALWEAPGPLAANQMGTR